MNVPSLHSPVAPAGLVVIDDVLVVVRAEWVTPAEAGAAGGGGRDGSNAGLVIVAAAVGLVVAAGANGAVVETGAGSAGVLLQTAFLAFPGFEQS